MKNKDLIEYYPNGNRKHEVCYYNDGRKMMESFYDKNGKHHRDSMPDHQSWYENGRLARKTYAVHGEFHNIHNPCWIEFNHSGKIWRKYYYLNARVKRKLRWLNQIKNI